MVEAVFAAELEELIKDVSIAGRTIMRLDPELGDIPEIPGIDIYGKTIQGFNKLTEIDDTFRQKLAPVKKELSAIGGDHLVFLNFQNETHLDGVSLSDLIYDAKIRNAQYFDLNGNQVLVSDVLDKNFSRGGIFISDVSGHVTDGDVNKKDTLAEEIGELANFRKFRRAALSGINASYVAGQLHQLFRISTSYELELYGEITPHLFDRLNNRLLNSTKDTKFVCALYGEISKGGIFRYLSAACSLPTLYRASDNTMQDYNAIFDEDDASGDIPGASGDMPLGVFPSARRIGQHAAQSSDCAKGSYSVREVKLESPGDILFVYTDGFQEHKDRYDVLFVKDQFKEILDKPLDKKRLVKEGSAMEIYEYVLKGVLESGPLRDDLTLVVVKRDS